jgi:PAS domain S-box-containing protein
MLSEDLQKAILFVLESAPDAMIIVDAGGRIVVVNGQVEELFGYAREELISKPIEVLVPARFHDRHVGLRAAYSADPHRRAMRNDMTLAAVRKDGTEFPVEISLSPMKTEEGMLVAAAIRDVTERKETEERLRRQEEELQHRRQLESIGRLAAGVAHDFNNLLTGIIGTAEDLAMSFAQDDPRTVEIATIRMLADRAAVLTRQLLAYGRRQIIDPKILNLNGVVLGLAGLLKQLVREDVEFTTQLDPALKSVKVDPGQFQQVIINLVTNARDAIEGKGQITLQTANVQMDRTGSTKMDIAPGAYILMSVSDTGCGMSPEVAERIFDPFFTTKEVGKGSGLGLSTVYGIVKQNRGTIMVYSHLRLGTTFKVYLPAASDSNGVGSVADSEGPTSEIPRGSETILVAEDEPVVSDYVIKALRSLGYNVLLGQSGKQAVTIFEDNAGRVDLLLTDVIMPGMNGRELADQLWRRKPDLRVLYMSGYPADVIAQHGILIDGVKFLEKPFTLMQLAHKARRVLDFAKPV